MNVARLLAAVNGLLGVGVGAFGAHALADPQAKAWVATGATYGLAHAAAALWAAERERSVAWAWGVGALLFSASLYGLGLGIDRSLAALAPVGGSLMLLGWVMLAVRALRG